MNGVFRPIVVLSRGIRQSRVFLLPVTFAAFALASVSPASAQQADVRISELQCNQNPEVVTISNQGSSGQDLSGWTLRSDPVATEFFDLSLVGVLAPGVSVFVQSGPQAQGSFVWSPDFVFRDSDATDFARVVDAQGRVVHEVKCQSPSPTTTPSTTASPIPSPTPAQTTAPINTVPVGGGPPTTGSWQSAGLMLAAGSWLIAAVLGAYLIARLRRGSAQAAAITTADAVYHSAIPTAPTLARGRWVYLALVLVLAAVAGLSAASERVRRPQD